MTWFRLVCCAVFLSIGLASAAHAQFLPIEALEIASTTFSDSEFLNGQAGQGKPVNA